MFQEGGLKSGAAGLAGCGTFQKEGWTWMQEAGEACSAAFTSGFLWLPARGRPPPFREEVEEEAWPTPCGGRKREGGVAEVCLPRPRPG